MTGAVVERPFARRFLEYGRAHPEAICLSADLTSSCEADDFRRELPGQFYSMGMAEQNLMGVAAGLAREGLRPFVTTFGVFATRRPYDQVAMSIAYPRLPVRLIGFLPGLTTPGGVTHQAVDDVALMRTLPNMTVLETADATDVETVFDLFDRIDGPVYCRMLRGQVPRLFTTPMPPDGCRVLRRGTDVVVASSGILAEACLDAVAALAATGVSATHLHVSTLKPFNDAVLQQHLDACPGGVVTAENHLVVGGLGDAVATVIAGQGLARRQVRVGLQDRFGHGGSREYLLRHYGLTALAVVDAVEALLGTSCEGARSRLGRPAGAPAAGSTATAEAL
ncbi:MAG TPA: transketolase C-terminal domain-containing protein [Candidatus Dormibacteraeota bacterium]|nr:transketolase C-terminal domain-containing protein [Candidatus Dormibacteraeota bacterium]